MSSPFLASSSPRLRETFYITRFCCSWPLLILPTATCQICARPFVLTRTIQAHTLIFSRAPVHACAPATRAHKLLLAIFSQALSPGDLLMPLSHANSTPYERPWMLSRAIHALSYVFARARIYDYTHATRAHPFLLARDPV